MTFGVYLYFIAFLAFSGLGLFVQYKYFSGNIKKSKKDELMNQQAQDDAYIEQFITNNRQQRRS